MNSLPVAFFSDVLCVWAYIVQARLAGLGDELRSAVRVDLQTFDVFGDAQAKIASRWGDRGGVAGYAQHVHDIVADFESVTIHPDAWRNTIPVSSLPAHLVVAAARCIDSETGDASAARLDHAIRQAFFASARDISQQSELRAIAGEAGIEFADLQARLDGGRAHALLIHDARRATELGIRQSPTLVLDDGRQLLSGNVGSGVIEANLRALMPQRDGDPAAT